MVLEHPFVEFMESKKGNNKALRISDLADETMTITDSSLQSFDVKDYNSMTLALSGTDLYFMGIEGRSFSGIWQDLKMIDEKLMLIPSITRQPGRYKIDLVGIDAIRWVASSSSYKFTANVTLSSRYAPTPLDSAVRYKTLRPSDGEVVGYFRAIEPLTDISLTERIRMIEKDKTDLSNPDRSPFRNGQTRLAGQPLYGPFDRVKIDDGEALLVLM